MGGRLILQIKVTQEGREKLRPITPLIEKIVRELAYTGEAYMKKPQVAPYWKGRLRSSIIGQSRGLKGTVTPHTAYARRVNIRSSSPRYIERTKEYLDQVAPRVVENILAEQLT